MSEIFLINTKSYLYLLWRLIMEIFWPFWQWWIVFFFEDSLIDTFGSPSSISVIPVHMLSKKSWIFNSKDRKYMFKAMGSTFCIGFLADIFELIFRNTIKVNNFRGYRKNLSVFTCFLYEISGKVYQPWQMPT